MTDEQKAYVIFGYAIGVAQRDKDDGLFPDMSILDVARLYLKEGMDEYLRRKGEAK